MRPPPKKMAPTGPLKSPACAVTLPRMFTDDFTGHYGEFLDTTYRCVDRIILNAYCSLCCTPGGFR